MSRKSRVPGSMPMRGAKLESTPSLGGSHSPTIYQGYGGISTSVPRFLNPATMGRYVHEADVCYYTQWYVTGVPWSNTINLSTAQPEYPLLQQSRAIWNEIVSKVQRSGRFVNYPNLSDATNPGNPLLGWLSEWATCYAMLRGVWSMTNARGWNAAGNILADAASGHIQELRTYADILGGYPIPPKLISALDRMSGIFSPEKDGFLFVNLALRNDYNNTSILGLDPTVSSTVDSIMTLLRGMLDDLTKGQTLYDFTASDASIITNVLSQVYPIARVVEPQIVVDQYLCDTFRTQELTLVDPTTNANWVSLPSSTDSTTPFRGNNNPVPFLVRKGCSDPLYLSLVRPRVFTADLPASGSSVQMGIAQQFDIPADPSIMWGITPGGNQVGLVRRLLTQFFNTGTGLGGNVAHSSDAWHRYYWAEVCEDVAGTLPAAPFYDNSMIYVPDEYDLVWLNPHQLARSMVQFVRDMFELDTPTASKPASRYGRH